MKKEVCHLSLQFAKGTNKNKTAKKNALFSAPEGWIIKGYKHKYKRSLGPNSYKVDWVPANSNFVSSSELSDYYNQAINLAADLGYKGEKLAELKADLNIAYTQFSQYSSQIAASHQTINHEATIRGAGAFNGRTQYEASLIVEIEEVPMPLRDPSILAKHFKTIIDDFASSNPVNNDEVVTIEESHFQMIQAGDSKFIINKYEQLVRAYWKDGSWKSTVVSSEILKNGSLCYSEKYNALFAITDDNEILVVRKVNGKWETGLLPTWGDTIVPSTIQVSNDQFGVIGVNEGGHLVTTWINSNDGVLVPGGEKLSFAVIHETQNLV